MSLECDVAPHLGIDFSKMKDGVLTINTARGPIIDGNALVEVLKSGNGLFSRVGCTKLNLAFTARGRRTSINILLHMETLIIETQVWYVPLL